LVLGINDAAGTNAVPDQEDHDEGQGGTGMMVCMMVLNIDNRVAKANIGA
jgi:hypothetical protein